MSGKNEHKAFGDLFDNGYFSEIDKFILSLCCKYQLNKTASCRCWSKTSTERGPQVRSLNLYVCVCVCVCVCRCGCAGFLVGCQTGKGV